MQIHPFPSLKANGSATIPGFALVATLMLMLLLGILALGMLSLSSISLRSSSQSSAMSEARSNARMALMIAIGELQKQMGPDKRISARGATLAKHPAFGTPVAASGAKAWWVGAASSDVSETIGSGNQPVVWLLSGLDQTASSANQIAAISPFKQEITLFGNNSIDLTLTGGKPITAGGVPVMDSKGKNTGMYAYFIEDNGMKAQLAASDPKLINDDSSATRVGGTVLPGSYDLSILEGMDGLAGVAVGDYSKMNSVNDLPLLGAGIQMAKNKRLGYTAQSLGVLSDVKKGGLKKDLTIAFENHEIKPEQARHPEVADPKLSYPNWPVYTAFDNVFKKNFDTSSGKDDNWDEYLVVDESKWGEFKGNGYIHWGMFRDYYNLKRYIKRQNGSNEKGQVESMEYLDPVTYQGPISFLGGGKPYANGVIAPHDIGPDSIDLALKPGGGYENMPYGDFRTTPNQGLFYEKQFVEYYKHSPISLVLTRIQTNAWVEQGVISSGYRGEADLTNIVDALRTRAQTFSTHYNPYNITMRCYGNNQNLMLTGGPPIVKLAFDDGVIPFDDPVDRAFRFSGVTITKNPPYEIITANTGNVEGRRYTASGVLMIGPGRSRIGGFGVDVPAGNHTGSRTFTLNIADNLDKSIYTDYNLDGTLPRSFNLTSRFDGRLQAIGHGIQERYEQDVTQWMWVPFAKQDLNRGSSEITIDAPGSGLGPDSSRTGVSLELRTTTDENASIRALIDANIRGFYFNPRWDSPLISSGEPLHTSAAYKVTKLEDLSDSQAPQMDFVNNAAGDPTGGMGFWGSSHDTFGNSRVILFDIPRKDLVSLGQLQHAGAGRFSYEPSYIVGNSYANPRIPLGVWKTTFADTFSTTRSGVGGTEGGLITLYDASYLINETLWDSFIFTTIPQFSDDWKGTPNATPVAEKDPALFTALLKREKLLPNPRFIPYEPAGSSFTAATLQEPGSAAIQSAFYHNAGHLLVDGSFNVNSTSVDAWEAFLSGTYGMPYMKLDDTGKLVDGYETVDDAIRFPRVQTVFGESFEKGTPTDEGYWTGFRALTSDEIRELAVEIVDQVVARGPFLTLGEFVNRKLDNGELGEKGALQAALDNTVNDDIMSGYEAQTTHSKLPSGENQAAGFPGQLLQGDVLQALSPFMTVRSDTFTIRAYGESLNPNTGEIAAKAWCEAVIQRYPDPVAPDPDKPFLGELALPGSPHGRVFRMTRFRWLSANEI